MYTPLPFSAFWQKAAFLGSILQGQISLGDSKLVQASIWKSRFLKLESFRRILGFVRISFHPTILIGASGENTDFLFDRRQRPFPSLKLLEIEWAAKKGAFHGLLGCDTFGGGEQIVLSTGKQFCTQHSLNKANRQINKLLWLMGLSPSPRKTCAVVGVQAKYAISYVSFQQLVLLSSDGLFASTSRTATFLQGVIFQSIRTHVIPKIFSKPCLAYLLPIKAEVS